MRQDQDKESFCASTRPKNCIKQAIPNTSTLGKRGRVTKLISQDYSSCNDLTQLESISPNQIMFSRLVPTPSPPPAILRMKGLPKKDNCWGWFVDE